MQMSKVTEAARERIELDRPDESDEDNELTNKITLL